MFRSPIVPGVHPVHEPQPTHGPGLTFPSCNPPAKAPVHHGRDPGRQRLSPRSESSVIYKVLGAPRRHPRDEADVRLAGNGHGHPEPRQGLSDYTGEIRVSQTPCESPTGCPAPWRRTQRPVQDIPFEYSVACAATPSNQHGSDLRRWTPPLTPWSRTR